MGNCTANLCERDPTDNEAAARDDSVRGGRSEVRRAGVTWKQEDPSKADFGEKCSIMQGRDFEAESVLREGYKAGSEMLLGENVSGRNASTKINTAASQTSSKNSVRNLIDKEIPLENLQPVTAMNPIAPQIVKKLESMPALVPTDIDIIRDLVNPLVPREGPLRHPVLGLTYTGQALNYTPDGWGQITTKRGEFIEGFFIRGKIERFVRFILLDGTSYEGGITNKMKNGFGVYTDAAGLQTKCFWINGSASGKTTITDSAGNLQFKGTISKGLREGQGYFYDRAANFAFTGRFRADKFDGLGKKEFDNGKVYEGEFRSGREHGEGRLTFVDGRAFVGHFENGVPHGKGTLVSDSGEEKQVLYVNGVRAKWTPNDS